MAGDAAPLNAQENIHRLPPRGTRNAKHIARVQRAKPGGNLHASNRKLLNKIYQHRIGISVQGRDLVAESNFDLDGADPSRRTSRCSSAAFTGNEKATVALVATFREQYVVTAGGTDAGGDDPAGEPGRVCRRTPRYNANRVDLNRNCDLELAGRLHRSPPGPHPWSEPERCAIRDFIVTFAPAKIVSLHWALAEIDADGPQSTGLARRMWNAMTPEERAPYRIRVAALEK